MNLAENEKFFMILGLKLRTLKDRSNAGLRNEFPKIQKDPFNFYGFYRTKFPSNVISFDFIKTFEYHDFDWWYEKCDIKMHL